MGAMMMRAQRKRGRREMMKGMTVKGVMVTAMIMEGRMQLTGVPSVGMVGISMTTDHRLDAVQF
jgi:hypothetical protein